MMLRISPSLFSSLLGIAYPATRPPITSLIDSMSEDESLICLGRLLQKYGELTPTSNISAKLSIFYILSELEKKLSLLEKDFNCLITFYYGINSTQDSTDAWFWTDTHKKLSTQILSLSVSKPPQFFQVLSLVSDRPSKEFLDQIKALIHSSVSDVIESADAKSLNKYIHTLLTTFHCVSCDDFGNTLLEKLLRVWSERANTSTIPAELPSLIHRLVAAVLSKDSASFEVTLRELEDNYGQYRVKPGSFVIKDLLDNFDIRANDINSEFYLLGKFDPSWWREQE